MNLFQIGLQFSLPVHTFLLTCETGYSPIFLYVYMTGCVKCHVYFSTFVLANESWFFVCRVLSFIFYWFGMVRRKLTIPERWQAVGMHNGGLSHRRVADHFRVNHSIIVRLMQRFRQTGNVTDRPRAGRPRKTTPREDRLISRRARQRPFSTAGALRGNLAFGGHISTRTVIRRLHHQGMRARRPINVHSWHYVIAMLDLTGHMIIWDGLFAHGEGSNGLVKVFFCYALSTVVQGFGYNETLHFRTTTIWAQLLSWLGCNCLGLFFFWLYVGLVRSWW